MPLAARRLFGADGVPPEALETPEPPARLKPPKTAEVPETAATAAALRTPEAPAAAANPESAAAPETTRTPPPPETLETTAASLDSQVLARLLEDGDSHDLAWLCAELPEAALAAWVASHGVRRLSRRSLAFWAICLDCPELRPERLPELERRRQLWPL